MKDEPEPEKKPVSEAKRNANARNSEFSTGPKDTSRSRFNALKHGLTGRNAWVGSDPKKDEEFIRRACERLGPRNLLEHTCIADLLVTRLQEKVFIQFQASVFTRRPVSLGRDDGRLYPFLDDPVGLHALAQLSRLFAHLTLAGDKAVTELLRVRRDNWQPPSQTALNTPAGQTPAAGHHKTPGPVPQNSNQDPAAATPAPGTLEDCLAEPLPVFPGEDARDYETLARGFWATFQPNNTLEGFVATDFIHGQSSLLRITPIRRMLLKRLAISGTGEDCGLGFAFVHDCQRHQALERLQEYEAALRKRLHKRMALFRKLRKEGWQDTDLPKTDPAIEQQPSSSPGSGPSQGVAEQARDPIPQGTPPPAGSTLEQSPAPPAPAAEPSETGGDRQGQAPGDTLTNINPS